MKYVNPLIFAIIGDAIGAGYEFSKTTVSLDFKMINEKTGITDDSSLTVVMATALRECIERKFNLKNSTIDIKKSFRRHLVRGINIRMKYYDRNNHKAYRFKNGGFYGGRFFNKFYGGVDGYGKDMVHPQTDSFGNGGPMRVSSIPFLFNTEEEVMEYSKLSALPSHNDEEGIKGTQAIALCIFLARKGVPKNKIKTQIQSKFGYDLDNIDKYKLIKTDSMQDETCPTTVPVVLIVALDPDIKSFEDGLRKIISFGGDTDTTAAMLCPILAALYDVPQALIEVGEICLRLYPEYYHEYKQFGYFYDELVETGSIKFPTLSYSEVKKRNIKLKTPLSSSVLKLTKR
ncbi:MAG: ADP-ribosylglycohydrolase family protein [Candidatus Paraimprobicoccus trichonymphae]|uniref:ADP-ribosylglycohydrolase family protein n=1 Tax=Candidatus Paraimprobicoccus trichonymphae TaxID=3033793 RepID=A0AA48IBF2_9FIRM|nr:MAG: ADP-ribosylglycohydrolase family protein [Candidatus Paraimprobicoccus trichonymphae]